MISTMKLFLLVIIVSLFGGLDAMSRARRDCAGLNGLGGAREPVLPMPGGFFPVELEGLDQNGRSQYDQAATKAVELMNTASNEQSIELVELLSVQTAVIAGTKYDLELSVIIDGQAQVCFVYTSHLMPWLNGGTWSVEAQCPDDPCAGFAAEE